ncbi:phage integrase N-terminal SAM-like domain-containing protein [Vibrio hippocampi]|uniref:phage integrase N-terminal SAM-like domain-containing protein n=1 Tax=Vibrio hippocampi TaxID=654686 RepID=UPI0025B63EAA|nr:phage integrase N-terminal SAM-like domain-containing protein [Vibrio hippocampi]
MKSPILNDIREIMYARHYAKNTVNAYLSWILQYIVYHDKKHPKELGSNQSRLKSSFPI